MVKAYLRYELSGTWGVLTSVSNVCYDHSGKYLITAALENILVWNVKQAVVVRSQFVFTSSLASLLADLCIHSISLARCAPAGEDPHPSIVPIRRHRWGGDTPGRLARHGPDRGRPRRRDGAPPLPRHPLSPAIIPYLVNPL